MASWGFRRRGGARSETGESALVAEFIEEAVGASPPKGRREPKLNKKLKEWWTLSFPEFRAQVKRQFKTDIPVTERNEWEAYLASESEKVHNLTREIENIERDIDQRVYRLFDLTDEEVKLLAASLEGQI